MLGPCFVSTQHLRMQTRGIIVTRRVLGTVLWCIIRVIQSTPLKTPYLASRMRGVSKYILDLDDESTVPRPYILSSTRYPSHNKLFNSILRDRYHKIFALSSPGISNKIPCNLQHQP